MCAEQLGAQAADADIHGFLHDLAQPLVVLDGYLLAIEAAEGLPAQAAEWVRTARAASEDLMDLVERFRSRLQDGAAGHA